ncbi:MAG: Uma2 family endonuclease, partial [Gemmataceae bacterium]
MTPATATGMPTHKDLPDTDGSIVTNYQEDPQSELLVGCLTPRLRELRPDGQFSIGTDNGIYWRQTDPPLRGCKSPDFFVVLGVPPMLDGEIRRSYVLWQELVPPLLIAEYVSGTGAEERDTTLETGKFWVYERGIQARYYAIFDGRRDTLEVYRLQGETYRPVEPNADGRYPVSELGVELGIWHGTIRGMVAPWLRLWDVVTKAMLPGYEERADAAEEILDDLRHEADEAAEAARLARVEREAAEARAEQEAQRAEQEAQRAEQETQRAEQE